jgi:hypothetical protein
VTAAVRAHGETGSYLNLDDPDDVVRHCTHISPGNRERGRDDHWG